MGRYEAALASKSPQVSQLSASGWMLLRRGSGAQLAPGGTLGGSQAGARLSYRVTERLALSGRLYSPVGDGDGAEAALGLEWQPIRGVPVRLLAERRQAIGRDGRSAFSLTAHGGISGSKVAGPFRLDAYVQAGIVGLRSRDLFVDGSARLGMPISSDLSLAASAWGAAQPGAARFDVGPEATLTIPVAGLRVSASYRLRVAGDARPGSGPALTLSTEF
jgi:hypothetical protein